VPDPKPSSDASGGHERRTPSVLSRRGFLVVVGASAALTTVLTAGQSVEALKDLALLAPRLPGVGPQGLPVNVTARAAGVEEAARSGTWGLEVTGRAKSVTLSLEDILEMPQHTAELPIACVEGWSSSASWRGVRLKDVVALVGDAPDGVRVESLQEGSRYRSSLVDPAHLEDDLTLLALELNGDVLSLDHGYPLRLIAPARPGVMQTKWLSSVVVL
jgi:DMSO/TMAO reductase YedYZ molybdopterin-dependent catalytic subunit